MIAYCECENPIFDLEFDSACHRCGLPLDFSPHYRTPDWVDTDNAFPFGPHPRYSWPGGYEIAAVMDDGEYLCIPCMNDPNNPVHIGDDLNDGWRVFGFENCEEMSMDEYCAHCSRNLS